jgi:hypothetical protein
VSVWGEGCLCKRVEGGAGGLESDRFLAAGPPVENGVASLWRLRDFTRGSVHESAYRILASLGWQPASRYRVPPPPPPPFITTTPNPTPVTDEGKLAPSHPLKQAFLMTGT